MVQFYQIVSEAIPPMPADQSALGTLPFAAYQYCEAIRAASAFGWYVFPAEEIRLRWDGAEVLSYQNDDWELLTSWTLGDEAMARWVELAPDDLKDRPPPYLSMLTVPGLVQVWSGFLIGSAPDWSIHIRQPANLVHSHTYFCYEAIIETDQFRPCPLFINLKLLATDREIVLLKTKPLIQVQPIPRAAYVGLGKKSNTVDISEMAKLSWDGVRDTLRSSDPDSDHRVGSYAARTRRRAKQEQQ